jgi:hypothetical protein
MPRFLIRTSSILIAAVLCAAFLSGCGERLVEAKIASGIEKRLPTIIGPAKSYDVSVEGRTTKMMSGKVSRISIHGSGVQLQPELAVDDLVVEMRGVTFDTDNNQLTGTDETTFQALLSDKVLTSYVAKRQPDLKQLKITMSRGKMTVQTRPGLLGVSAGVSLTGGLELAPGNKVCFVPDRMSVAGLSMPGMVVDFVTKRINPVMDLSLAGFPAQIVDLAVVNGGVRVSGTADLSRGLGVRKGS